MNFQQKYAKYYDLFYGAKNYEAEAKYILRLAEGFDLRPHRILDLGCGTGRHAVEWAKLGIKVHGVEGSKPMFHQAIGRVSEELNDFLSFSCRDLREFENDTRFDIATAMFAVLGYISDEDDLISLFRRIHDVILPGGLFICDTWNGAAVFKEGPVDRMAVYDLPEGRLYRFVSSRTILQEQVCLVHYTLIETESLPAVYEETHRMRFFSPGEMRLLAKACGMELVHVCPFMRNNDELALSDWNASWVFRRST
jgi:SAM-dependent methyltransferase